MLFIPSTLECLIMRANKYLYTVPLGDGVNTIIFNGINKKFLTLNKEVFGYVEELINNPNKYNISHKNILTKLRDLQFVVEDNFDEKRILQLERESFIDKNEYKTTILPTFECNYNCWYCVQKHVPLTLNFLNFDLIVNHIKKYLIENNIKYYVLSWFGGEPLTQPKVIEYIASKLIEFCESKNIEFSSGITSNGALLNISNIKLLQCCKVNFYQIAIDGDEVTHNKIKKDANSENSFKLILTNIVNLLTINVEANIILRINYTLVTLKSNDLVNDITRYIPKEFRKRIRVDLQRVWQIKEQQIPLLQLRNLQEKLVKCGFELCTEHVFATCYVEKTHYNMLYYNGGVEKCDKRPIEKLRGRINEEGDIVWNERPIFSDYDLFDDDCVCSNCKYYPICYCGCPVLREERIKNSGKVECGYKGQYEVLQFRVQDYCWRVINNRKILC